MSHSCVAGPSLFLRFHIVLSRFHVHIVVSGVARTFGRLASFEVRHCRRRQRFVDRICVLVMMVFDTRCRQLFSFLLFPPLLLHSNSDHYFHVTSALATSVNPHLFADYVDRMNGVKNQAEGDLSPKVSAKFDLFNAFECAQFLRQLRAAGFVLLLHRLTVTEQKEVPSSDMIHRCLVCLRVCTNFLVSKAFCVHNSRLNNSETQSNTC